VKSGRQVPPKLLQAPPEVHDSLAIYVQAFWDLCGDRQNNRITWVARHLWCQAYGIEGDDAEDLIFLVGRMDIAYIDWAHKKANKKDARPGVSKEKQIGGKSKRVR
jgi:hypothetical protein